MTHPQVRQLRPELSRTGGVLRLRQPDVHGRRRVLPHRRTVGLEHRVQRPERLLLIASSLRRRQQARGQRRARDLRRLPHHTPLLRVRL